MSVSQMNSQMFLLPRFLRQENQVSLQDSVLSNAKTTEKELEKEIEILIPGIKNGFYFLILS